MGEADPTRRKAIHIGCPGPRLRIFIAGKRAIRVVVRVDEKNVRLRRLSEAAYAEKGKKKEMFHARGVAATAVCKRLGG
jgi:hypothetical protein